MALRGTDPESYITEYTSSARRKTQSIELDDGIQVAKKEVKGIVDTYAPNPETRNTQHSTLNIKHSILSTQHSTLVTEH